MKIPILKNNRSKDKNGRKKPLLAVLAACTCMVLCLLACGCTAVGDTDETSAVDTGTTRSADWTEETHGNDAEPNYSVVFPDDKVNEITITLSPENWQTMLDDMAAEFGEFGGSTTDQTRAMGGGGNQIENPDFNQATAPADIALNDRAMGGGAGGNREESFDFDPVTVPAGITFDDKEWTDVGIRFKGQSTLGNTWTSGSYKISLKLNFDKFEDENPDIKNQRFYGFDELNLKSAFGDSSLMRDKIAPEIFNDAGVAAPDTAFYRVYVDYGEGPVYFGLYTMIESVEDTLIETAFTDDSGNVYKPEGTGATFAEGTFDAESFEKKTNEDEEDWSDVEALYTILNDDTRTTDPEEWRENLEAVFDAEGFVKWLAVNTVIQNWDSYGTSCKNFYLYTDPSDGAITWIPWDNNEAISAGKNAGTGGRQAMEQPDDGQTNTGIPGFGGDMQPPELIEGGETMPPAGGGRTMGGQQMAPPMEATANEEMMMQNAGGQRMMEMPLDDAGDEGMMMQNAGGGGKGSPLSLGLDEVGDSWPLIRYLMDDPVYHAMYLNDIEEVVTTAFEPEAMEEKYQFNHELITPYVTGADGETEGHTNLKSTAEFDASLSELIEHTYDRYDAVMTYLSTQ
ncbi:CotH kinase family protein [Methanoplanus endosymbiosus]|uniref:CotH kinase family protein n=1 Tax=Methanoplanus endosymbiosus TaxID=33865 RepID=A0A9E7PKW3_9EURY|nr:CotH kinase family protein [Methanoplanus endosymbiosus]UUX91983.1 CotH kinase family protein [Methanoplanus endosymbiosus]